MPAPLPPLPGLDPIPGFDLAGVLGALWRGLWIAALCVGIVVGMAGVYAFRIAAPTYAATATVSLEQPHLGIGTAGSDQITAPDDLFLNSRMAAITGHETLSRVVNDLRLTEDPAYNRYLVDHSPFSRHAVRTQVRHALSGTQPVAPTQAVMLEKTIQNLAASLHISRRANSLLVDITAHSGDPDRAQVIANAVVTTFVGIEANRQEATARARQLWLQNRIDSLTAELAEQDAAIGALLAATLAPVGSGTDRLGAQILATDREISALRADLAALDEANSPTDARLTAVILQRQSQLTDLTAQRDRMHDQIVAQSQIRTDLTRLQRAAGSTRQLYDTHLNDLQQVRIARELRAPAQTRIAYATSSTYLGPQKLRMLSLAVIVGGALGLVLIALREALWPRVQSVADLGGITGLPVLGVLARRKAQEQGTAILTALSLQSPGPLPRHILITEAARGDAAQQVATALAAAWRRSDPTVQIIDLRRADDAPGLGADASGVPTLFLAPSVMINARVALWAQQVDHTVLAIGQNRTTKTTLDHVLAWLGGSAPSLVLTTQRARGPAAPWPATPARSSPATHGG